MSHNTNRHADHPVFEAFVNRWSRRAYSEKALDRKDILTLLEASRWAPSAGNGQPWRYLWALKGSEAFSAMCACLVPGNLVWAQNAGALLVLSSLTVQENNGKPNVSHSFDAGAAWMSLALQASLLGLSAHGLAGFDKDKTRVTFKLPTEIEPQIMIAVGYPGEAAELPEALQPREIPSARKPVQDFAFEGFWPQ
jgi:nitroreductase